jgi:hypothetical protein
MDLFATRLVEYDLGEKGDELRRGVPRGGSSQYLAGLGVESGVEGKRAVAIVLKAVPLQARAVGPDP